MYLPVPGSPLPLQHSDYLRSCGILVRHFATPGLADWLRISEMMALIDALRALTAPDRH